MFSVGLDSSVKHAPRKRVIFRVCFRVFVSKVLTLVLGTTRHFDWGNLLVRRSGKILWFLWSLRGANFMPTRTAEWAAKEIVTKRVELCFVTAPLLNSEIPTQLDIKYNDSVSINHSDASWYLWASTCGVLHWVAEVRSVRCCAPRIRSDFHGKEVQLGQAGKLGNGARVTADSVNWGIKSCVIYALDFDPPPSSNVYIL